MCAINRCVRTTIHTLPRDKYEYVSEGIRINYVPSLRAELENNQFVLRSECTYSVLYGPYKIRFVYIQQEIFGQFIVGLVLDIVGSILKFLFKFQLYKNMACTKFYTLNNGLRMPALGIGTWRVNKSF